MILFGDALPKSFDLTNGGGIDILIFIKEGKPSLLIDP
jgi:hypothetical protein